MEVWLVSAIASRSGGEIGMAKGHIQYYVLGKVGTGIMRHSSTEDSAIDLKNVPSTSDTVCYNKYIWIEGVAGNPVKRLFSGQFLCALCVRLIYLLLQRSVLIFLLCVG
jgi:hypothetical protein